MCPEYILRKLCCHRAHSGTYCSTLWTWEKCHIAIGYKNSSRRVLNSPFLHGQIPLSQRKQEGLPGSSTHSYPIFVFFPVPALPCSPLTEQKHSERKGKSPSLTSRKGVYASWKKRKLSSRSPSWPGMAQ